jgi:predicted GNAT superfamily acetyltransferase
VAAGQAFAMIQVRALTQHSDFEEAVRLQQEIWGFTDIELLPVRLFVVATKVGGQAFGAFDGDRMIGFCLAIPGLKAGGGYYLHSHMLGVLPQYRNTGVGRMLKIEQRNDALSRGIELIEWTFDPLEIKNAFFNMERLGAIARRFLPNQYGTTTSHLHGGLPTDRLVAEWWIGSARVKSMIEGEPFQRPPGARSRSGAERHRGNPRGRSAAGACDSAQIAGQFQEYLGAAFCHRIRKDRGRRCLLNREMGIKLERITLRQIRMPLVHFFETSFGRTYDRDIVLVEVSADGLSGWGEVTAGENPFYNEEWTDAAWLIVRNYVAPRVLNVQFESASQVAARSAHIRGHNMARGGLEAAVWDLEARMKGAAAVAADRRRCAEGDSLRGFHRHPEFRGRTSREDRDGGQRRVSANQDEDQAGVGRRRCPRGA